MCPACPHQHPEAMQQAAAALGWALGPVLHRRDSVVVDRASQVVVDLGGVDRQKAAAHRALGLEVDLEEARRQEARGLGGESRLQERGSGEGGGQERVSEGKEAVQRVVPQRVEAGALEEGLRLQGAQPLAAECGARAGREGKGGTRGKMRW